jgi:hypothetical protein
MVALGFGVALDVAYRGGAKEAGATMLVAVMLMKLVSNLM